MIYLNKLLPLLLSPLVLWPLVMLVGVLSKKRWLAVSGLGVLWLLSTPVVSNPLFRWIESDAIRLAVDDVPSADAVVVLGGMQRYVAGSEGLVAEWADSVDRFEAGLDLMAAGKSSRLVFTAGKMPWQRSVAPEGVVLVREAIERGVDPTQVFLTREVRNTDEESRAVREVLADRAVPRVILVTSAFHMPRAAALFEAAGVEVIRFPVDFRIRADAREPTDYFPDADALRRSDLAVREWIGRAYYRARAFFR